MCLLPVDGAGGMYPYGTDQGDFEMTCYRLGKQCYTRMAKIPQFKVFNTLLDKISVSINMEHPAHFVKLQTN